MWVEKENISSVANSFPETNDIPIHSTCAPMHQYPKIRKKKENGEINNIVAIMLSQLEFHELIERE